MRFIAYILVATLVTLCTGCGSDDTSVSVTIPPDLCIGFEPSVAPAAGTVSTRLGVDSDCDVAYVEVVGTDIDGVFAVAAHAEYDSAAVAFAGLETTGSALAPDPSDLLVRVEEVALGELTIGVARNASDAVHIVGTQLLLTLYFVPLERGAGDITIETPCLTDGAEPPVPLGSVACSGGSFTVVEQ
jgi:hypothetical protein